MPRLNINVRDRDAFPVCRVPWPLPNVIPVRLKIQAVTKLSKPNIYSLSRKLFNPVVYYIVALAVANDGKLNGEIPLLNIPTSFLFSLFSPYFIFFRFHRVSIAMQRS